MSYNIGLDISGGDYAPDEVVKGALLAKKEFPGVEITLIGTHQELADEQAKHGKALSVFHTVGVSQRVEMADAPAITIRKKRDSSLVVAADMVKAGKLDAFVSCGNTGAVVCASSLGMGMIEGVERPGIGIMLPTLKGASLVVDVGANIDPKPMQLFQYGIMAAVYYNLVMGKEKPTVGMLNIGEEETKGSDDMKRVHKLFSSSSLNFIGNVEAKSIFSGECDCIVCDGLIGNIALKVSESCAEFIMKSLKKNITESVMGVIGAFFLKGSFNKFKHTVDYAEYGGAPLLGVNGNVIIAHGRSNSVAVKNAVRVAIKEQGLNHKIKDRVDEICRNITLNQILTA